MDLLGYRFNDINKLHEALTHSSYAYEHGLDYYNERLELLGDSVLNLIITDYLFVTYPELSEGNLSKLRSNIVSEKPLYKVAAAMNLGSYLLLSRGEKLSHGDMRPSTLADTVEAIIGAVYLDGGFDAAKVFVLSLLAPIIEETAAISNFNDYKSELQERLQIDGYSDIKYEIIREEGPDHDKMFFAEVKVDGKPVGQGSGRSKKDAEQKAAQQALGELFGA
ncbi:MAG: ribonuclease [Clostridiales bacterium]|jgi:ribonuclease-3|nr:ribonuclease [Clostridiales bacterium]